MFNKLLLCIIILLQFIILSILYTNNPSGFKESIKNIDNAIFPNNNSNKEDSKKSEDTGNKPEGEESTNQATLIDMNINKFDY
ncbi:hypothetical protein EBI_24325 [Enterocytozoon bieneusi H348]|nr:hypothetical protein EBI_24325 [Enterocytozoon bieneusi H348]|eukprot:XP_002649824.1 hypothetical protein EBI_24325 [Enterocytozoon bieneusi H348]